MAEVTIAHLTEVIQVEGQESEKRDDAQLKQLATLNKSFEKFFKAQQGDKLEELETQRETKGTPVGGDNITTFSQALGDVKGGGVGFFVGLLGKLLAGALGGLAIGLVAGLKDSFLFAFGKDSVLWKMVGGAIRGFFNSRIIRTLFVNPVMGVLDNIAGFFRAIPDAFAKAGTGQFVKGNQFLGRALKPLTAFFVFIKRVGTFFSDIGRNTKAFFTSLKPVNAFLDFFKNIGTRLGNLSSGFKSALAGSSIIQDQIQNFKNLVKSFSMAGSTVKSSVGIIQRVQDLLQPFFGIFKRLGRFLGGPITVALFSIIDGFIGSTEAFKEQTGGLFPKIIAGIAGFASGIISGFVGGLLDLGKMAVGFIAGLFGFDDFKEKLAEFSFRDIIFDALMFPFRAVLSLFDGEEGNMFSDLGSSIIEGIKNIFVKIKDMVVDKFKSVGKSIAGFFGFGDDEEIEPPVKEIKEGQVVAEVERVEVEQPEPRTRVRPRRDNVQTAPMRDIDNVNDTVASIEESKASQNINVPIVDNSSNVSNTSSNMAVYGDPSPASDDLDIVA